MPPKTTLWPLDGHTYGKHMVLQRYMDAWLPIMLSSNDKVLFIDAFAGPGRYSGGQKGSPVIALEAFHRHRSRNMMIGQISYMFIEKEPDRAQYLKQLLDPILHSLPTNCHVQVFQGTFASHMTNILDAIDSQNRRLAPTFAMIDPFGVSDTPMSIVKRILSNPKSEVYISFMYEAINRFKTTSEFSASLNSLFGCQEWRKGIGISDADKKKKFFYGLYRDQLKKSGTKHVLHFELYEGHRLVYALFFATKNDVGCDKMKQAMWKVAPLGGYRFRSDTLGQLSFQSRLVDFNELGRTLVDEFGMNQPIEIETIEEFMRSDRVVFHSGHLKSRLADMERASTLIVDKSPRKRRGFPPGTLLRFVEPPPPPPIQGSLI